MNAFLNHLWIQFKMDIREKGTLLTYYLVPLVFYLVIGAVFSSVNPASKQTMAAAMPIFAITMGAVLGMPVPIVKMREAGVLRAYRVSGIPGWAVLLIHSLSAFLHLMVVTVIIFVTAPLLYGANIPQNIAAYFLILLILLFANIALGLLIGVSARSQSIATILSQAVFLPTVMLGGIMFPASMLPEPLRIIGYVLPSTHAMQAFSSLAYGLPSDISAAISLSVMAGIGVLASGLAVVRYRTSMKS
jgi:ABC-2 type transport system permease protein